MAGLGLKLSQFLVDLGARAGSVANTALRLAFVLAAYPGLLPRAKLLRTFGA